MIYKLIFENLYKIMPEWTWIELEIGFERFWIKSQDVVSYAVRMLDEGIENFDLVLALSIADEDEVGDLLKKLAMLEKESVLDVEEWAGMEENAFRKWAYAIIRCAYDAHRTDIFEIIDDVYTMLGYPEYLQNLIVYMPGENGMTLEENLQNYIGEEIFLFINE